MAPENHGTDGPQVRRRTGGGSGRNSLPPFLVGRGDTACEQEKERAGSLLAPSTPLTTCLDLYTSHTSSHIHTPKFIPSQHSVVKQRQRDKR